MTEPGGVTKRRRTRGKSNNRARERVTIACDQCRRRKDKCDGEKPVCAPCRTHKRTCQYSPSKRRGLQTGYVRALEMLLGLLQTTIHGSGALMLCLLDGSTIPDDLQHRIHFNSPTATPGDPASQAIETWRSSAALEQIECLLGMEDDESDERGSTQALARAINSAFEKLARLPRDGSLDRESNMENREAHITPSLCLPTPMDSITVQDLNVGHDHSEEPATFEDPVVDDSQVGVDFEPAPLVHGNDSRRPSLGLLSLPPNWSELVNVYFSSTHCWLPLCQKHDLLRSAYQLANSTERRPAAPSGDDAFLWAVLAYASHVSNLQESMTQGGTEPQELAETAEALLPCNDTIHSQVGHVRALVLLALLQVDHGQLQVAWISICRAIQIATDIGIAPSSISLSSRRRVGQLEDSEKRAMLGCMVLETIISTRLQRRPYFQASDIEAVGFLGTDAIEEWESWQPPGGMDRNSNKYHSVLPGSAISIYNHFIRGLVLWNEICITRPGEDEKARQLIGTFGTWKQNKVFSSGSFPNNEHHGTPQILNLHCFSTCASIRLGVLLGVGHSSNFDSEMQARRVTSFLSGALRTSVRWLSPVCNVYLSMLDSALEPGQSYHEASLDDHPQADLRRSINELRSSGLKCHCALPSRVQPTNTQPSEEISSRLMVHNSHSVTYSKEPIIPPQFGLSGHGVFFDGDDTATSLNNSEFTAMATDVTGIENSEDNNLFDFLASLDPDNWVTNPDEDFMRHLGVMRGSPTDIHEYFDIQE